MAPRPPEPGTPPADADAPAEPDEDAADESPEKAGTEAQAAVAPSPKPAAAHSRPAPKLVPADDVVAMKPVGGNYVVRRGRLAGLREGMVLQVVAEPGRDGKARLLGEAKVVDVRPRRTELEPDASVRAAGKVARFLVLPASVRAGADLEEEEDSTSESKDEPKAPIAEATPSEEKPAQPRELNGRARAIGPPLFKKLLLTNSDNFPWGECTLIIKGRDFYKLKGIGAGVTRKVPLGDFKPGGMDLPYVDRERVRVSCEEGQAVFVVPGLADLL